MSARAAFIGTLVVLAMLPATTRAQAPATPATPPPPSAAQGNGNDCAPSKLSNPNAPPGVATGQSDSAPLSDKLAAGNGVLCPPNGIDPEIRAPTPPDAGRMPIIPPPGSPGGDKSVQPK